MKAGCACECACNPNRFGKERWIPMGMSSGGKKTGAKPDINITPLIDVLLVMIIIFMVIKHKDPHQFESKVPEKPKQDTPPPDVIQVPLVLSLDLNGTMRLNSQERTPDALKTELKAAIDQRPTNLRTVFIKAPRQIPYEKILTLVDIAKGSGAAPIGLQIDNLE